MCGIVGIYLKSPALRPRLGEIFSPMLIEMSERGPDSSGVAVYRENDTTRSGKVIAYDPYQDQAVAEAAGVRLTSLEEVMQADYVSVHPPLSPETRGLVGAEQLALMKPTAYLITTCRGGVVNEQALYDALKNGQIAGAGVDVWDPEPVHKDHPLLEFDNVIATPHSAYYSDASAPLLLQRVGEAAADVLQGYLPRSVVNKAVLDNVSLSPHPDR